MLIPASSKPKKETPALYKELLNVEFYSALTCPPRRIRGQPLCFVGPGPPVPEYGWKGRGRGGEKKNSKLLPQKLLQPANSPIREEGEGRGGKKVSNSPKSYSSRTTLHLPELPLPVRQTFCFFPDSIPGDHFPPPHRSAEWGTSSSCKRSPSFPCAPFLPSIDRSNPNLLLASSSLPLTHSFTSSRSPGLRFSAGASDVVAIVVVVDSADRNVRPAGGRIISHTKNCRIR